MTTVGKCWPTAANVGGVPTVDQLWNKFMQYLLSLAILYKLRPQVDMLDKVVPNCCTCWPILTHIDTVRQHLTRFCKCCHNLLSFCQRWQPFANFGKLWSILANFGNLWQTLANFGKRWQYLAYVGELRPTLVKCGKLWQTLASFGKLW